jgi:hypothetical protein
MGFRPSGALLTAIRNSVSFEKMPTVSVIPTVLSVQSRRAGIGASLSPSLYVSNSIPTEVVIIGTDFPLFPSDTVQLTVERTSTSESSSVRADYVSPGMIRFIKVFESFNEPTPYQDVRLDILRVDFLSAPIGDPNMYVKKTAFVNMSELPLLWFEGMPDPSL